PYDPAMLVIDAPSLHDALPSSYAPELKIAGAAMGGVPMNLVKMLEGLGFGSHPVFGLAMAAGIGLEREYPERFPISDQLNAKGLDRNSTRLNSSHVKI